MTSFETDTEHPLPGGVRTSISSKAASPSEIAVPKDAPPCHICGNLLGHRPFRCGACDNYFCEEHAAWSRHRCLGIGRMEPLVGASPEPVAASQRLPPKRTTSSIQNTPENIGAESTIGRVKKAFRPIRKSSTQTQSHFALRGAGHNAYKTLGVLAILILAGSLGYATYPGWGGQLAQIGGSGYPAFLPANPSLIDGRFDISYPQNYAAFSNYALSLINTDRAKFGAPPLTLGSIAAAQQHADSMDYFGYFEHGDVQGYSAEQRFDMLGGGSGLVGENQGLDYCNNDAIGATQVTLVPCNVQTIENAIANSEWAMMYNDATCCNNLHRTNILSASYSQVMIGIAYNSTTKAVYFVEDFYGPCPTGYTCS